MITGYRVRMVCVVIPDGCIADFYEKYQRSEWEYSIKMGGFLGLFGVMAWGVQGAVENFLQSIR